MEYIQISNFLPRWLVRLFSRVIHALEGNGLNLLGDRDIEWSWIATHMPDGPGQALDFGPGGSYLGLLAARKGFNVTALDIVKVKWPYYHPLLIFIQGDIVKTDFPHEHFDLVINCSTVEHVGLAGRFDVTTNELNGDLRAMQILWKLLKPNGIMLLTIPIGQDAVFSPLHRVYGSKRLPLLLKDYVVEKEEFWVKNKTNCWIQQDKRKALKVKPFASTRLPMNSLYALGCFFLRKEG